MMSLFAKILSEFQAIYKFAIRVSFEDGGVGIDGFFRIGFGQAGQEGDGYFIFEFFVDKIDDFFGDGWLSGFGFAGSGSWFSHLC